MATKGNHSTLDVISDDDISLNSSDSEQEEEYIVEAILAERLFDDLELRYLVKWENYGEQRCTWEPSESFLDPRSLRTWTEQRDAGVKLPDEYIDRVEAKIREYEDGKAAKISWRQSERRRIEHGVSQASTVAADHASSDAGPEHQDAEKSTVDSPLASTLRLKAPKSRRSSIEYVGSGRPALTVGQHTLAPVAGTATRPVFHGISIGERRKGGQHAHRTGSQPAYKDTRFRNLRHMNNARKAAQQQLAPDQSKIKLRSLAEWADEASEQTNLQLPPAPPASITSANKESQVGVTPNDTSIVSTVEAPAAKAVAFSTDDEQPQPPKRPPHTSEATALVLDSRARQDNTDPMRFDPYEGKQKKMRTLANGRHFIFPGEFVARLYFGKAVIGDVRVRGLPNWAIGKIIKVKTGDLMLEIGSNDVVTTAQWAHLCTGRSNSFHPTGIVTSYPDTDSTVREMEQYLYQHSLAALWYHPTEDITLVFYSPRSSEWLFLEAKGGLPFDSNIRVLSRNRMPPTKSLAVEEHHASEKAHNLSVGKESREPIRRRRSSFSSKVAGHEELQSGSTNTDKVMFTWNSNSDDTGNFPDADPADSTAISSEKSLHLSNLVHGHAGQSSRNADLVENKAPDSVVRLPSGGGKQGSLTSRHEPERGPFQPSREPGEDIRGWFYQKLHISYKYLTAVPPSRNADQNPAKARFYLFFPKTARAELAELQRFLRSHTFHTNICTSLEDRGWEAFQNIFRGNDYIGVIIFHHDCVQYHTLPRLANLLRSSSLNVFRISLHVPLGGDDHGDPCYIERLFPTGTALLFTEASLVSHGAALIQWFARKRRGPRWKLVLRPNVKAWLRRKALDSAAQDRERYWKMLKEVETMSPGFSALRRISTTSDTDSPSDAESMDGTNDGSGGGPILSPATIAGFDDTPLSHSTDSDVELRERILVEFFAGWSIAHASVHRKLVAVTPFTHKRYSKWGHIEVLTPESFMRREGIEGEKKVDLAIS